MVLKHLSLQHFRSYKKTAFDFSSETTVIVGPNTSGKSNLIEAIFLLASGKSFRAMDERQMIAFNQDLARVKGDLAETKLEVVITQGDVAGKLTPIKKYLVNDVSKRRTSFIGNFVCVLF